MPNKNNKVKTGKSSRSTPTPLHGPIDTHMHKLCRFGRNIRSPVYSSRATHPVLWCDAGFALVQEGCYRCMRRCQWRITKCFGKWKSSWARKKVLTFVERYFVLIFLCRRFVVWFCIGCCASMCPTFAAWISCFPCVFLTAWYFVSWAKAHDHWAIWSQSLHGSVILVVCKHILSIVIEALGC